jgi:hypothetical protein
MRLGAPVGCDPYRIGGYIVRFQLLICDPFGIVIFGCDISMFDGGYFGSNSATHFGLLVPGISDQIVPLESVELV